MQTPYRLLLLAALALCLPAEPAVFPTLKAANLNGQEIVLPTGLEGEQNLVLVAFLREQQKVIDTWLKALPEIAKAHPSLRYYECPTIQRPMAPVRFFINSGMRGGIPDQAQRARTITLYIDKKPFKQALGITSETTIYAFLLDKSGRAVWREEGLYTEAKGQALRRALP